MEKKASTERKNIKKGSEILPLGALTFIFQASVNENMVVEILLSIAVLLIFAKIFGEMAERIKLSPLAGEIIGGLLAGPVLRLVAPQELLGELAGFGILFVIFLIGLQTNFDGTKGNLKPGLFLGLSGSVISFLFGFIIGYYVFGIEAGLVMGVAILSTSTAITVRSISDLGELHSKAGKMIVAIDTVDEVIAIIAFSTLVSYFTLTGAEMWKIATLFFSMILAFFIVITFVSKFFNRFLGFFDEMNDDQFIIAMSIVLVFLLSFLTQQTGIAAITGAFLAGLMVNKSSIAEKVIIPKINTISSGFFAPLFFAYSALFIDIASIYNYAGVIIALFVLGILAKFVGSGVLSGYYGFRGREQITVGIGMIPRGEYSIIVAYTTLAMNIITPQVYTAIMAFVFLSMILAPLLFRKYVKQW